MVVGWSVSLRLTELIGLSACDGLPIDPKTIEITENGTYNVLPFGRAVVDVQGGTPAIDANIQAGNIKKDVQILGVTGTMENLNMAFFSVLNLNRPSIYSFPYDLAGDLVDIGGLATAIGSYAFRLAKITSLRADNVVTVSSGAFNGTSEMVTINLPKASVLQSQAFFNTKAKYIIVGKVTAIDNNAFYTKNDRLLGITVGQDTAVSLPLRNWTNNADPDELNANIVSGLADKVADRTNDTALTITFGASLYNVLTADTIAAFTAKNWNVASA